MKDYMNFLYFFFRLFIKIKEIKYGKKLASKIFSKNKFKKLVFKNIIIF